MSSKYLLILLEKYTYNHTQYIKGGYLPCKWEAFQITELWINKILTATFTSQWQHIWSFQLFIILPYITQLSNHEVWKIHFKRIKQRNGLAKRKLSFCILLWVGTLYMHVPHKVPYIWYPFFTQPGEEFRDNTCNWGLVNLNQQASSEDLGYLYFLIKLR